MRCPVGFRPLFLLGDSFWAIGGASRQLATRAPISHEPPERDRELRTDPNRSASFESRATTVMDSRSVAERVRQIAEQAAIDHGVELVHAEVSGPGGHPL